MCDFVNRATLESEEQNPNPDVHPAERIILNEFDKRFRDLEEAFGGSSEEKLDAAYQKTKEAFIAIKILPPIPEMGKNLYLTDYRFLLSCYKLLTKTENEGFCLVSGPEIEGRLFSLTRWIQPEMRRQSPAGAEPDRSSLNTLLDKLGEGDGGHLTGYFHSHPGNGKGSTRPSGIDIKTQERLERGGYPVIGCIFSRDGYLSFYSHQRDFNLKVSGKGGEQVGKRTFKLKEGKVKEV